MQERRQVMELQQREPMEDGKIVELYWNRDEKAIEETDFKYKKYLFSIAYNILHSKLDCEECLNDTYLGAWNAIPPSRPNVLKAFLITITRRIAIKRYHSNSKKNVVPSELTVALSELEDFIADDNDVVGSFDAEKLGCIISEFVRSLSERKRFIFMSRYYVADSIDAIANNLSLSRSMVNKELAAIRRALKEELESEGYLI
jgi:RNA polymerase sigma-70 factor (ECF subfamily)